MNHLFDWKPEEAAEGWGDVIIAADGSEGAST